MKRARKMFEGKHLFVKHPSKNINKSQIKRASIFLEQVKDMVESIEYIDGHTFDLENVELTFSEALPHGPNTRVGYVVEVGIVGKDKVLFMSDVEGAPLKTHIEFALKFEPDIVLCDGPMTYQWYSEHDFLSSLRNME